MILRRTCLNPGYNGPLPLPPLPPHPFGRPPSEVVAWIGRGCPPLPKPKSAVGVRGRADDPAGSLTRTLGRAFVETGDVVDANRAEEEGRETASLEYSDTGIDHGVLVRPVETRRERVAGLGERTKRFMSTLVVGGLIIFEYKFIYSRLNARYSSAASSIPQLDMTKERAASALALEAEPETVYEDLGPIERFWHDHPRADPAQLGLWTSRRQFTKDQVRRFKDGIHTRAGRRLLWLCRYNRGIFVKSAQYLSTLNHVLPKQITSQLSILQNDAPYVPFSDVEKVFADSFQGRHPDDLFDGFERSPIAAASLAQVHRARTKDGRPVAVKVQYPALLRQFTYDLDNLRTLARTVRAVFPDFDLLWILDEFQAALTSELDFLREGRNANRISACFTHNPSVYVPQVYWDLTTRHVLTMEFVVGSKVNDKDNFTVRGYSADRVGRTLISAFADQIFVHGFVHGDPHPGNILIRPHPRYEGGREPTLIEGLLIRLGFLPPREQIVLLDHGLYIDLPEKVRMAYAHLWVALLSGDQERARRAAEELGAGELWEIISFMVLFRPVTGTTAPPSVNVKMTRGDWEAARSRFEKLGINSFSDMMNLLPRQLFYINKTNNLLRFLVDDLGGRVNRLLIMASSAVAGTYVQGRRSLLKPTDGSHQERGRQLSSELSVSVTPSLSRVRGFRSLLTLLSYWSSYVRFWFRVQISLVGYIWFLWRSGLRLTPDGRLVVSQSGSSPSPTPPQVAHAAAVVDDPVLQDDYSLDGSATGRIDGDGGEQEPFSEFLAMAGE